MKYFAMINGERQGPFRLEELAEAGVQPTTYVWCKGMADWQTADEVADICRYFRQHISDMMASSADRSPLKVETEENNEKDPFTQIDPEDPYIFRRSRPLIDETPDTDIQPVSMLIPAIILFFLCFPPTGIVAIFYGIMTRRAWAMAHDESRPDMPEEERKRLALAAHDYSRSAKLWTGITFFLGLMLYAFLLFRN